MNRRSIVLVSVAGALLAAGVAVGVVWSVGSDTRPSPGSSVVHQVTESPQAVETYWTPERMRDAKGD
jgi:hypothetical protein